jgi:ribosomal protein S14
MTEQSTNYRHKIDFLISDNIHLSQPTQTIPVKSKQGKTYKKCNGCNRRRKPFGEDYQFCRLCYKLKSVFKSSGNKIIDDFIKYTQINLTKSEGKMEFVPYDQFKNIEFIAEGGFSKIYKATWIDGPIHWYSISRNIDNITRLKNDIVVLKKLVNSKNITTKELNEV